MKNIRLIALFLLATFVVSGCTQPAPSPIPPIISPTPDDLLIRLENQHTETAFIETLSIPLENCSGSGLATAQTSRERSTTAVLELNFGVKVEAGVPEIVSAEVWSEVGLQAGQTLSASQDITVEVAPGTKVIYELTWYETWKVGDVVIPALDNLTVPYRMRTGVQAELKSGSPQVCPTTPTITETVTNTPTNTPVTPTEEPSPTPTPTTSPPTVEPTRIPSSTPTDRPTNKPTSTPTVTPSPTFTLPSSVSETGKYPCEARIIDSEAKTLNVVRASASNNAPPVRSVTPNEQITITSSTVVSGSIWYQIVYQNSQSSGWISIDYVIPSESCP